MHTRPFPFLLLILGSILLIGCSRGGLFSAEPERIAESTLSSDVDYHPDSLQALSVDVKNGQLVLEMGRDFQVLLREWSSTGRLDGANQAQRPARRTFATFWSRELSLASLQPELGIQGLDEETAMRLMDERENEYFDTIQIDIYAFRQDGVMTGSRARARLEVADTTLQETIRPRTEAVRGTRQKYRRHTLSFPRTVNDRDLLEGESELSLTVTRKGAADAAPLRPPGAVERMRFEWKWKDGSSMARDTSTE